MSSHSSHSSPRALGSPRLEGALDLGRLMMEKAVAEGQLMMEQACDAAAAQVKEFSPPPRVGRKKQNRSYHFPLPTRRARKNTSYSINPPLVFTISHPPAAPTQTMSKRSLALAAAGRNVLFLIAHSEVSSKT